MQEIFMAVIGEEEFYPNYGSTGIFLMAGYVKDPSPWNTLKPPPEQVRGTVNKRSAMVLPISYLLQRSFVPDMQLPLDNPNFHPASMIFFP